jgi:hypothetical protein
MTDFGFWFPDQVGKIEIQEQEHKLYLDTSLVSVIEIEISKRLTKFKNKKGSKGWEIP